jgi:hypothetical protein
MTECPSDDPLTVVHFEDVRIVIDRSEPHVLLINTWRVGIPEQRPWDEHRIELHGYGRENV